MRTGTGTFLGGHGNGIDRPLKFLIRIGAGPERNLLAYLDVGNFLLRNRDFRRDFLQVVDLCDQVSLSHQLASHSFQLP